MVLKGDFWRFYWYNIKTKLLKIRSVKQNKKYKHRINTRKNNHKKRC